MALQWALCHPAPWLQDWAPIPGSTASKEGPLQPPPTSSHCTQPPGSPSAQYTPGTPLGSVRWDKSKSDVPCPGGHSRLGEVEGEDRYTAQENNSDHSMSHWACCLTLRSPSCLPKPQTTRMEWLMLILSPGLRKPWRIIRPDWGNWDRSHRTGGTVFIREAEKGGGDSVPD